MRVNKKVFSNFLQKQFKFVLVIKFLSLGTGLMIRAGKISARIRICNAVCMDFCPFAVNHAGSCWFCGISTTARGGGGSPWQDSSRWKRYYIPEVGMRFLFHWHAFLFSLRTLCIYTFQKAFRTSILVTRYQRK